MPWNQDHAGDSQQNRRGAGVLSRKIVTRTRPTVERDIRSDTRTDPQILCADRPDHHQDAVHRTLLSNRHVPRVSAVERGTIGRIAPVGDSTGDVSRRSRQDGSAAFEARERQLRGESAAVEHEFFTKRLLMRESNEHKRILEAIEKVNRNQLLSHKLERQLLKRQNAHDDAAGDPADDARHSTPVRAAMVQLTARWDLSPPNFKLAPKVCASDKTGLTDFVISRHATGRLSRRTDGSTIIKPLQHQNHPRSLSYFSKERQPPVCPIWFRKGGLSPFGFMESP